MVLAPDIQGFVAADRLLRGQFGDAIVFSVPLDPVWPLGTRINPDTGEPYSAMVVRSNSEFTTVEITALVVLKEASPLRPQADTHFSQVGLMSGMDIILDIDGDDYSTVAAATEFQYIDKHYRVEEWKGFQMANVTYRYLCYGQER